MKKPEKYSVPAIGTLEIREQGKTHVVFNHLVAYLTSNQADELEKVGKWFIEASEFIRGKKSPSHRDF